MGRDHKFRHFQIDLCCLGTLCSLCYNPVFKITLRKRLALFGSVPLFPLMTSLLHMSACLLEKCLLMLDSLNTVIHNVFESTKYQMSALGEAVFPFLNVYTIARWEKALHVHHEQDVLKQLLLKK